MAAQQPLFTRIPEQTTGPVAAPPSRTAAAPPPPEPSAAPVWLQRASLIVLVLFCFYIGALLAVMPWSPRYWDSNGFLLAHPAIDRILEHGWARGLVSGIGLLDIWIGISELIHYRDYRT